jgi:regulator of protease activity HflC (stomatin/prohibitin superfamily)
MEKGNRQAQPLTLDIALYMRWPEPAVEYEFGGTIGTKNGTDLLKCAYYYLPRALRNPDQTDYIDVLGRFLENAVIGGVKVVVGRRNHLDARQQNQAMEEDVKTYLLSEPGNPFKDLGIPPQCLDIELTKVVFPADTAQALRDRELARRSGEARVTTATHDGKARVVAAKHRKEASSDEAEATRKLLQAHLDKGVSPEVAALIVSGGVGGEGMSIEQLRDLAITMKLGTL